MLEFWDGTRTNHKQEFKMKSTCTTKKKGDQYKSNGNGAPDLIGTFQAQVLHDLQLLGGGTTPLLIVYSMPFYGDYIQMSFFLRTTKWESQN